MSRRRASKFTSSKSKSAYARLIAETAAELEDMCGKYDGGSRGIIRTLSVVLLRFVDEIKFLDQGRALRVPCFSKSAVDYYVSPYLSTRMMYYENRIFVEHHPHPQVLSLQALNKSFVVSDDLGQDVFRWMSDKSVTLKYSGNTRAFSRENILRPIRNNLGAHFDIGEGPDFLEIWDAHKDLPYRIGGGPISFAEREVVNAWNPIFPLIRSFAAELVIASRTAIFQKLLEENSNAADPEPKPDSEPICTVTMQTTIFQELNFRDLRDYEQIKTIVLRAKSSREGPPPTEKT